MRTTLFISDLHLDPGRPATTELFVDFLHGRVRDSDGLYILGDLFEVWIGDDDTEPMNAIVMDALAECTRSNIPVFFMSGNRDFLVGKQFAERTGCTLLEDPAIIDLYGQPTLLMHGDTLCTDDTEYQAYRSRVRDPVIQAAFMAKSLQERRAFVGEIRENSRDLSREKPEAIMDVNQQAVIDIMTVSDTRRLIHGHTHRPAIHELSIDGSPARRYVLGDWYENGNYLECTENDCRSYILPEN